MRDKFDVEFSTKITTKKSPDFVEVKHKAVAGASEKDLIERNTIGKFETPEDEDKEEEQTESDV